MRHRNLFILGSALALSIGLAGCGGGGGGDAPAPTPAPTPTPAPPPPTASEAGRFLTQASFGPTTADIAHVQQVGYAAWIDEQLALPATAHLPYVQANYVATNFGANFNYMQDSFWQQALGGQDQLRQRVKFALSEILVVSASSGQVANNSDGLAAYFDILGADAFGNYRKLLDDVSTNPIMGIWLTFIRNQKADASGRSPDENYAREVMQLFTIGLLQLNADGSVKTTALGQPLETYTNDDITGLARVFTGWSWAAPTTSNQAFAGNTAATDPQRNVKPMQPYPQYHELGTKTFLGVTIPANTDARASLTTALDTLFNHPNLCPFVGKQLIQRLVTSNPSPAYVGRVSAACANNGAGVRGDMKAIVKAILLDAEARDATKLSDPKWGKLREPVLRLSNWARCFNAKSTSGNWLIRNLDSPSNGLNQQPLRAATVFNFFRPGYVPQNTDTGAAGLTAPEFQITNETSVAGYTNFMQNVVVNGVGVATGGLADVRPDYSAEAAIAADSGALVDRIDACMTYGTMPAQLRTDIRAAVDAIPTTANGALFNRVYTAVLLTLASPDYIVQK